MNLCNHATSLVTTTANLWLFLIGSLLNMRYLYKTGINYSLMALTKHFGTDLPQDSMWKTLIILSTAHSPWMMLLDQPSSFLLLTLPLINLTTTPIYHTILSHNLTLLHLYLLLLLTRHLICHRLNSLWYLMFLYQS